jgi:hypothetical protein
VLCRRGRLPALDKDYIHLEANEICRQFGKSLKPPFRKAILKGNTLALYIAEVTQPLAEGIEGGVRVSQGGRQNSDTRRLRH